MNFYNVVSSGVGVFDVCWRPSKFLVTTSFKCMFDGVTSSTHESYVGILLSTIKINTANQCTGR